MTVDPAMIYVAFGALAAVIGALWVVVLDDKKKCNKRVEMLTDHTIAQQIDIMALVKDRRHRGLPEVSLESERTEFWKKHIEHGENI
jgi:hypothetical protein